MEPLAVVAIRRVLRLEIPAVPGHRAAAGLREVT
jgi:hypothetical protein